MNDSVSGPALYAADDSSAEDIAKAIADSMAETQPMERPSAWTMTLIRALGWLEDLVATIRGR